MTRKHRASVTAISACLFILVAVELAHADPVVFVTTGTFNNIPADSGCTGDGTNELRCSDGRQITFVGNSFSQELTGRFSNSPLGVFQFVGLAPSTTVGPLIPAGITFTLTVDQLSPTPGSAIFLGTIVIQQEVAASFNVLRFNQHTVVIGGIEYNLSDFFFPSANLDSSVRVIPEPASILLLGTGLTGVAIKMRKRFKGPKTG